MSEITIEEMKNAVDEHCNQQMGCGNCPLYDHVTQDQGCVDVRTAYHKLFPPTTVVEEVQPTSTTSHDVINHPEHYCRDGAMESIDEMVLLFGKEVVKHFCLCNIWKYRYRSNAKNGEEDVKKSDWYVQKYKELCE